MHGFCYYCAKSYDDERNLSVRCGNAHLRNCSGTPQSDLADIFDEKIFKFISMPLVENEVCVDRDLMKKQEEKFVVRQTKKVSDERYDCLLCNKMFEAPNFVYNHIANKHTSVMKEAIEATTLDAVKLENYIKDKNKVYEKFKISFSAEDFISCLKQKNLSSRKKVFKKYEVTEDLVNYRDFDKVQLKEEKTIDYDDL